MNALLDLRFSKQSSMTPRVGSSSNKAVHVAIKPRARRLTLSWVVYQNREALSEMGENLNIRGTCPICDYFFETLCECLGCDFSIYLDSDVLLERLS